MDWKFKKKTKSRLFGSDKWEANLQTHTHFWLLRNFAHSLVPVFTDITENILFPSLEKYKLQFKKKKWTITKKKEWKFSQKCRE